MVEYRNRYGDVYTFTKQEDDSVLWEGEFRRVRVGDDFVDPSGGPFIKKGQNLSDMVGGDLDVIVESFENVGTGYLIKTKK